MNGIFSRKRMLKGPVLRQTPEIRDLEMSSDTWTNAWQPMHSLGPFFQVLV